jgi:hypothetical protein
MWLLVVSALAASPMLVATPEAQAAARARWSALPRAAQFEPTFDDFALVAQFCTTAPTLVSPAPWPGETRSPFTDEEASRWARWLTAHASAFTPGFTPVGGPELENCHALTDGGASCGHPARPMLTVRLRSRGDELPGCGTEWVFELTRLVVGGSARVEVNVTPPGAYGARALAQQLVTSADAGTLGAHVDLGCLATLEHHAQPPEACAARFREATGSTEVSCDGFDRVTRFVNTTPELVPPGERPVWGALPFLDQPLTRAQLEPVLALLRADRALFGLDDDAALEAVETSPGRFTLRPEPVPEDTFAWPGELRVWQQSDGPGRARLCVTGHAWPRSALTRTTVSRAELEHRLSAHRWLRTITWAPRGELDRTMGRGPPAPPAPPPVVSRETLAPARVLTVTGFTVARQVNGREERRPAWFVTARWPEPVGRDAEVFPAQVKVEPLGQAPALPAAFDGSTGQRLDCRRTACGAEWERLAGRRAP